jgi:hypothetical protein
VSALLLVLEWGGTEYAWASSRILGLGAAGVLLSIGFVIRQQRAKEPILPLRLFREPVFSVSMILSFLIGVGMFGGIIYLPVFLQIVTGASATNSGLLLLPLMAGMMATSITSGRIIARTGRYRSWPILGMAIASVGMFLLSTMDSSTGRIESSLYMLVLGVGLGMVMQVLILAVQNAAPVRDLGVVTSSANFFRSLGGSFGVAVFGAILGSQLSHRLADLLPAEALATVGGEGTRLVNSPEAIRALPPAWADGVVEAVAGSIQVVFLAAVPVLVLGWIVSFFLRGYPLRDTVHAATAETEVPATTVAPTPAPPRQIDGPQVALAAQEPG